MYVLKRATRKDETAFDIGRDRVRGSRETRMSSGGGPGEVTEAQRARAAANKAAALARRAALENQRRPPPLPPPPPRPSSPRASSHFVPKASALRPGAAAGKNARGASTASTAVSPERVRRLNFLPSRDAGTFVLLWVQSAQRARHNESLEFAAQRAVAINKPLVAAFAGTGAFPWANERHLAFMYDGLCEMRLNLETQRNIQLLAFVGDPGEVISAASANAAEVVVDGGYTRVLREWRRALAARAACAVWEVESEVVAPVYAPNGSIHRAEKAAATLRAKIWPRLETLASAELVPTPLAPEAQARAATKDAALALVAGEAGAALRTVANRSEPFPFPALPLHLGTDACLDALDAASPSGPVVDRSVRRCDGYHRGGEAEAHRKLEHFLAARLDRYAAHRNDPGLGLQSHLSPHVHYGQISVVYLTYRALRVAREGSLAREREQGNRNDGGGLPEASSPYRPELVPSPALRRGVDKYLDELVIRRELAVNFVLHEPRYDRYEGVPQWARRSLAEHAGDARKHVYTLEQFEACRTHDALWNACQREIVVSGKMHNYVRMFWCKKILEWSASPEEAWRIAIHLNNKYGLDGRDPVSYTGVGWCFGLHDRPFPEADVTGATRRMSENGMRGKFRDGVEAYARKWGEPGDRAGSNPGAKRRASSAAADSATPNHAANAGGRQMRLKEMFGKRPRMR